MRLATSAANSRTSPERRGPAASAAAGAATAGVRGRDGEDGVFDVRTTAGPGPRSRRIPRMRFVVTGGAGFIGSNTVDELVRRGHSVVVLDDLSSGKEENLAEFRNKITLIKGSITDIEVVRKAMHEAECVLHLSPRTSVPRSVNDPIETNRINIDGALNVLVAARDAKVQQIVFAASSSAYAPTATLPNVQTLDPQPTSPYA